MVLALSAPFSKRKRLDAAESDSSDHSQEDDDGADDADHVDSPEGSDSLSRSPSPAAGAAGSSRPPRRAERTHRCDICSKTFARHEHMLRHRASHTDAASLTCNECGKRFRRSDVLQRHQRLHITRKQLGLDASNTKLTKRQRSALARVEAACLRCSAKKLKCSAEKPSCARCSRIPGVTCIYPASTEAPAPAPAPASAPAPTQSSAPSAPSIDSSNHLHLEPFPPHLDSPPLMPATPSPAEATATSSALLPMPSSPVFPIDFADSPTVDDMAPQVTSSRPSADIAAPINDDPGTSAHDSAILAAQHTRAAHTQISNAPLSSANDTTLSSEQMLHDLIGWLDGPSVPEHVGTEQIDWIFANGSEPPQLLDWTQIDQWAQLELPARPLPPSYSDVLSVDPSFDFVQQQQQHQQQPQQQQPQQQQQQARSNLQPACSPRHRSIHSNATTIQQNSPLFVLSSAAELIDFGQRGSGFQTQLAGSRDRALDTPHALPSAPTHFDEYTRLGDPHRLVTSDAPNSAARATPAGRSRWNSPEPVDVITASSRSNEVTSESYNNESQGAHASDAGGLPSLHHSGSAGGRKAASTGAWPNRWNPAVKENSLPSFTFTRACEEHLMAEDMAHVKGVSHTAVLRMVESLKNAASGPLEEERYHAAFSTLDAATLNLYLQLFFQHCYSCLPAIHQATFDPDRCDPRLLAALCAVGAFFSEVPGSHGAAFYLASLTQISFSRATTSNHALARVTSTFQTMLIVFMIWRSVGVPSRQEYAEAFRSTYCTMVRRARLLESLAPPRLPAHATLDERWTAWISWESGRRTAWSTLVSETELSVHWNLPEAFAPDELSGKLPCDDRLWEAPTATEWMQTAKLLSPALRGMHMQRPDTVTDQADELFLWPDDSNQLDVATACDILQRSAQARSEGVAASVTDEEREAVAQLSPFSRLCVGSAVMLSTHHTMKMVRFCPMLLGDEKQARARMRTYLSAATEMLSTNQAQDARVDMLLQAIQLFELVSPEMLQLLSCRRGIPRMQEARAELSHELNVLRPWKTARIVLHAGQLLRLAKQSLQRAPVESLHIFYAAVALQAVSQLVLQQDTRASDGTIVRIVLNGPARPAAPQARRSTSSLATLESVSTRAWRSGSFASVASSTSPMSTGAYSSAATGNESIDAADARSVPATFILESVGNLAHPLAPERILSLASKWLRASDGIGVWPICQSLAKILETLSALSSRPTS